MKENRTVPLTWLTRNWGLKIASILLACVFWFIVTNYNDPVISVPFYNIPVTLRNTALITDAGQVYEVLENSDSIATVTISAPRSIAESFTRDNIIAYADFSELTSRDTIPIHLSVNKNTEDNPHVSGSTEDVRLSIEDRKTRTIALTVTTSGQMTDGYIVGSVTPAQNLVRISGAASRVDQVATASADVDVTGFISDIGTESDIRLYDAEGVLIRDSSISQNIATVRVSVSILQTKTVGVTIRLTGVPADGYRLVGEAQSSLQTLTVAGAPERIAQIGEIVVEGGEFDLTGRTESLNVTVDLADYLPAGIVFADPEAPSETTVTLGIEQIITRTVTLSADQFILENVPPALRYLVDAEAEYDFTLVGLADDINALDPATLAFSLDIGEALGDAQDAPQMLVVQVNPHLPAGVELNGTAYVTVMLQE